jgi:two-component system response regulator RegX3
MSAARILLVEDEPSIADSVTYAFKSEGFDVEAFANGEDALERFDRTETDPDVVLLDVMLPGLSGLEVCRRIRSKSCVPILMLTARTAEVDIILGLQAGADDYVLKPFSVPELIERVRALIRRQELNRRAQDPVRRLGGLELDLGRLVATVDGRPVKLTTSEFRLLTILAEHPGNVYSRRQLMQRLWDSTYVGDARAADVHVANLRSKIEADPRNPIRLVTVRGAGYALLEV